VGRRLDGGPAPRRRKSESGAESVGFDRNDGVFHHARPSMSDEGHGTFAKRDVDAESFRRAMRCLAATVNVTTSVHDGVRAGITMTSVCAVTMEPPTLLACIRRDAAFQPIVRGGGRFMVNILEESQAAVAQAFAGPSAEADDWEDRFAAGDAAWSDRFADLPALDGALANLACRIVETVEAGSHTVFFGELTNVRLHDLPGGTLLYAHGAYQGLRGLDPESA
jgi:flavin reductase (DIM6/NTAB) family NADH-FMN oxidoreductase RutF